MISNPSLVLYACIAKGPTILAEFSSSTSKDPGIEIIAQQCIEKTPPHHSMFSHTVRKKTYTFLIQNPFAYFAIFDESMDKSESLWFLNRLRTVFDEFLASNPIKDDDKLTPLCFQGEFYPVFSEILALNLDLVDSLIDGSNGGVDGGSRNPSLDSTKGGKLTVMRPLLSKPSKVLMKKKKRSLDGEEVNGNHHHHHNYNVKDVDSDNKINENGNAMVNRELSVSMLQKGGGFYSPRQKAKQIWRRHVWVVLVLDLVVCAVLFGIWLWVCRGFQCIDG